MYICSSFLNPLKQTDTKYNELMDHSEGLCAHSVSQLSESSEYTAVCLFLFLDKCPLRILVLLDSKLFLKGS